VLVEPDDGYGPVDAFIGDARRTLDMTMYELADPEAEAALEADAARGVDVRVLLDADDAGRGVNGPAATALAAAGVHVAWADAGEIFHQKTITVDGATSLIMTGNLTSQYDATTRDFGLVDADPADVAAIESTFDADLSGGAPGPAPAGTDLLWSPGSEGPLVALIGSAQHAVVTESEEMDSTAVEGALEADARRGVDVEVVMTDSSSWDAAFAQLAAAGVHVVLYRGESPLYIHAKVTVVDAGLPGQRAFLGSQNFSTASMRYNRELGVVTADPGVVGTLASVLEGDARGGTPWS
jgi:phosphatidylserine/phosphatidylglycerophosphate/cardiolipin synthase-like enzyme